MSEKSEQPQKYISIEFVTDGLTAWGNVWLTGQKVTIPVNGDSWKEASDRRGNCFIDLDDRGQIDRWGKVYFRRISNPESINRKDIPRLPKV